MTPLTFLTVALLLGAFLLGLVPWCIALILECRRRRDAPPSRSVAMAALLPFVAATASAAMPLFAGDGTVGFCAPLLFVGGVLLLRRSPAAPGTLAAAAALTVALHTVRVKDNLYLADRARTALRELDEGEARFCREPYQPKYDEFYNGCLGVAWAELGYQRRVAMGPWLVGTSALATAMACASVALALRSAARRSTS
jgi:hypothetical protein